MRSKHRPGWSRTNPDRYDERKHTCGCETYFDVALWRSVTKRFCAAHREIANTLTAEETPS